MLKHLFATCMLTACLIAPHATAAPVGLMAGTGKANIDPAPALFPLDNGTGDAPMVAIHDSLFARALFLQSQDTRALIVAADMIILPDDAYDRIVARITATYGIPADHILLSVTHCHTVPWSLARGYEQTVSDGIMAAISQALSHPEPVTVGRGDGQAFLNINRDEQVGSSFILGQDPQGPSDKTVRVTAFFRSDKTPLAILANYAVHAVTLHSSKTAPDGRNAMVSADLPGVTDTFVDDHYGPGTMTLWTSGAAGDQNPILMSFYMEPDSSGKVVTGDLKDAGFIITQRFGENLGREIIRVTNAMKPRAVTVPLRGAQAILNCPAKADPAATKPLRLSYLGIGDIDLLAVSGEVVTHIDQTLRKRNAGRDPILLTLTNGYDGYIPDDDSYARGQTFEVGKTSFAPGCAETGIADMAAKLLAQHPHARPAAHRTKKGSPRHHPKRK